MVVMHGECKTCGCGTSQYFKTLEEIDLSLIDTTCAGCGEHIKMEAVTADGLEIALDKIMYVFIE